ncbi:hypothetical protein F2Q70_00020216 [Brassica cretica]|uniref:Uncharacterized protein n=1 Tax=Brassica cretica TaxID=69181 RepID=A0A8S9GQH4_BRACR|nr:hypothetical protein F2Q70_00020216 [Brassica cretica]KAF2557087.1 hypothetical protein F2Q68_00013731 [Brassica cretica]
MGSTRECIEEFKINLLSKMHDEIREELNKMAQYWEDHISTGRQKMEKWKTKMNTRDGRANGDTASQPAKILEVVTDLQVPVESMELYYDINGAPIFDVYDEEEPIYDIYDDAVPISHINGDGDVAVLGSEYFEKNIQAMDSEIAEDICSFSCFMHESSFAHSPKRNEFFKEFIDVSHIEAVITQLWIRRVAHKKHVPSISAPTHPNHSHELLTSTPKLSEEQPVSGRPPPLRDKKFIQPMASNVYGEGIPAGNS